jgi:hypothetical protein
MMYKTNSHEKCCGLALRVEGRLALTRRSLEHRRSLLFFRYFIYCCGRCVAVTMTNSHGQGDLRSTLMENGKYVESSSVSPSPCALQCQAQQQSIVDCVDRIRESPDDDNKACLAPAVGAWTRCCADANLAPDRLERVSKCAAVFSIYSSKGRHGEDRIPLLDSCAVYRRHNGVMRIHLNIYSDRTLINHENDDTQSFCRSDNGHRCGEWSSGVLPYILSPFAVSGFCHSYTDS